MFFLLIIRCGFGFKKIPCWGIKKGIVSRLSHFLKYTIIYKTTILNIFSIIHACGTSCRKAVNVLVI